MPSRIRAALLLVVAGAVSAGALATLRGQARPRAQRAEPQGEPAPLPRTAAASRPGAVRYVAVGGGAFPESTEVSLEQDLALATRVLPGPGAVLFAAGRGSRSVRVEQPGGPADPLLVELGQLFQPRPGRRSHYRVSELPAIEASRAEFERTLGGALELGGALLTLYVAAHGEQGDSARDNQIALWGGEVFTVAELAELHERHTRPMRVLMASCYSGGFAELAFEAADPERGASRVRRCGLFAGTWDRQTSGCDPNPDRAAQEGYSLHLWHALEGRDRHGRALASVELDFDGDGRISLLEAHTRARIASRSIDVPTTTSERYLREVVGNAPAQRAPAPRAMLPEEWAVLDRLGPELGLVEVAVVQRRFDALSERLDALAAELDDKELALDRAFGALAARLLARWPVLDDAYHPQFAGMLQAERESIAAALRDWPESARYRALSAELTALEGRYVELQVQEARVLRLRRAHETLRLAAVLAERGGEAWRSYGSLLDCERAPLP